MKAIAQAGVFVSGLHNGNVAVAGVPAIGARTVQHSKRFDLSAVQSDNFVTVFRFSSVSVVHGVFGFGFGFGFEKTLLRRLKVHRVISPEHPRRDPGLPRKALHDFQRHIRLHRPGITKHIIIRIQIDRRPVSMQRVTRPAPFQPEVIDPDIILRLLHDILARAETLPDRSQHPQKRIRALRIHPRASYPFSIIENWIWKLDRHQPRLIARRAVERAQPIA